MTPTAWIVDGRWVQRCAVCGVPKDLEREFNRTRATPSAHPPNDYRTDCRPCRAARLRRWRASRPGYSRKKRLGIAPGGPELPVAPLAALLDRMIERGTDSGVLCDRLGISDRTLRAWRVGDRRSVRLDLADRILLELGLLWFDVWTPDDPESYQRAVEVWEGQEAAA